ncbi:MAG: DNA-binding response regulator [Henriciella sp.]|uniref:winged helix-turn-helix domain-containing protein n=1 Tax=Henriciella sp. TaxID=1968823 RepID=UPI000C0F3AFE|nr:response regulator transcription factor [Henriciella sp.]MAN73445.1 DNA-binding response regulator [Henriciella sp.]MBF33612.1 DNA-binding response regulator [Hyphomonadaceae bacterium]MBK76282.1 DNA-binding response regulator [Henriciella sp.]PHR77484.1 MAG: DNA-binding response regulator [Henriciella sp.]
MRYLLVEDDRETAGYVIRGFREHGDVVDHAADGQEGLMMATDASYDALILDRMVPGIDGLKLLNMLRAGGDTTPAIFLTAIGGVEDRVEGLQVAEDYLVKPFAFAELHARVGVLVRSAAPAEGPKTTYQLGGLTLDRLKRTVERDGEAINLQPVEFRLLEYLMRHEGRVVTRTMLLENVWDFNFDPRTNIVETHISRLRSKIDKGHDRPLIHTVRGSGYRLSDNG